MTKQMSAYESRIEGADILCSILTKADSMTVSEILEAIAPIGRCKLSEIMTYCLKEGFIAQGEKTKDKRSSYTAKTYYRTKKPFVNALYASQTFERPFRHWQDEALFGRANAVELSHIPRRVYKQDMPIHGD